jgi:serine/alanine adding enzyme
MTPFSIVEQLDPEVWDKFVFEHSKGSIFHTSLMVEVYRRAKNQRPVSLAAVDESGAILALLVAVRVQTLPPPFGPVSSRSIFYAEPLCREDALGVEALGALVAEHDAQLGKAILFTEVRPLLGPAREKEALTHNGYQYKNYLNFLVHLNRPSAELWADLNKRCRQNIRSNVKKGLVIEDMTTNEGVEIAYSLIKTTYDRARVPLADKSLFSAVMDVLQPRNMVKIFVAYWHGVPVGTKVMLLYRERAYAWYSGHSRIKSIYPAESLGWHAIDWSNEHHYAVFDWGGAGWPNIPYGVRDFKAKFGGELVDFGRYRKVYSSLRFMAAEKAYEAYRLLRATSRRLRRTETDEAVTTA